MNKAKVTAEVRKVIWKCENTAKLLDDPHIRDNLDALERSISILARSSSGSWLGYHANVYYRGFQTPPPGDHFSTEWGLMALHGHRSTGGWHEMAFDTVRSAIFAEVDPEFQNRLASISEEARAVFDESFNTLSTLVEVVYEEGKSAILEELKTQVHGIKGCATQDDIINEMRPHSQLMSRDSTAVCQGIRTPPHCAIEAWLISKKSPFYGVSKLVKVARRLLKYMEVHGMVDKKTNGTGIRIFIGHGRSPIWRELKDFIEDRLHLPWDEFNREPTAGISTSERLQEMLDSASFALLVMTGESGHADATVHARDNVIHEAGLFQGRLGFRRAIVLLENSCSEFSNIVGLSQIRFPEGNISAVFEDVRRVLEREGLLSA